MFDGKVVLVTGASRGIGRQIAYEFAIKNAFVVINYSKNFEAAKDTYNKIKEFTPNVMLFKADVSKYKEVECMFNAILDKWGRIDILINNAGVNNDRLFVSSRPEDWDESIGTNLKGVMNCCHIALPFMLKSKKGKIINISSVSVYDSKLGQTFYTASKAGMEAFTKALAKEVGRWNINANIVVPGLIQSDMTQKLIEDKTMLNSELNKIPLKRVGSPSAVAETVLFLASEKADYITGAVINVDGGISA